MTNEVLEQAVLEALTAGDHPTFEALRAQLEVATVDRREQTDGGFFTYFTVPRSAPAVRPKTMRIGDLQLVLKGASTPADAVLHISGGYIDALECYVFDGAWPDEPQLVSAYYYGTEPFPTIGPELFAERDVEAALEED